MTDRPGSPPPASAPPAAPQPATPQPATPQPAAVASDQQHEPSVGAAVTLAPVADPSVLTASSDRADEGWRRLSVRMLLVHPIQEVRRALVPLLVLIVFGRGDRHLWPYAAVLIVVAIGLIRWLTTTYRVTPTQVQVRRGLLGRSTLSVPRDRVRTVDLTSHLMHRVLGLARLTIGTGQTDRKKDDALRLDALTTQAAVRLRDELLHDRPVPGRPAGPAQPAPAGAIHSVRPAVRLIARLNPAWVRYAPFTLSGLVTVGVFAGFLANVVNQARINPANVTVVHKAGHELSSLPIVAAVVVVLLIVIVVVALLSAGGYILAFWNFRLTREGGTLHVARGLLTTRATTIESRRLRGAEISAPLLLRWVRGARAIAITTGLRVGRGAERGGSVLMPAAPVAEVERVVGEVIGTPDPARVELRRHGRRARRRRFNRALLVTAAIAAILVVLWQFANWPAGFPIGGGVLVVLAVPVAYDRYRNLGHALSGPFLVTRAGSLVRRRYVLDTAGIIGWNEYMSFFQRRAGLVTLVATTAAGRQHYQVVDLDQRDATALAEAATPGMLAPFLRAEPPIPQSEPPIPQSEPPLR
jgi:putative membrane protein